MHLDLSINIEKKKIKIGSCKHADVSTFSLHPVKTITSGEGGIITTNNNKIAKNISLFRSHGILRNKKKYWKYDVVKQGFNYRISDISCALGLSQLKKINFFLKKRKQIYNKYLFELKNFDSNLIIPNYSKSIKPSFHLFVINIFFDQIMKNKEHFIKYLIKHRIAAQQHYIPIYKFSIYSEKLKSFYGAESYFKNSISVPIYVGLNNKQHDKIIKIIKNYFK